MSALDAAGVRDALDKVFLAVQEQQQTRDHIHRRHGEGKADLAGVNTGKEHRERLRLGILEQDKGLLDHVPIIDKDKDRDRIERRTALGQADLGEDLPLPRSVHLCRLDKRIRDTAHEFRQQENRERREHAGQDDRPRRIQNAEPLADEIVRHERDLIRHEHKDNIEEEYAAAYLTAPAGEAVGRDRRNADLKNDDRHNEEDTVPELEQIFRGLYKPGDILRERDLIGDELEVHGLGDVAAGGRGKDHAVVGFDLRFGHE